MKNNSLANVPVKGSIQDVAEKTGKSRTLILMGSKVVVWCDGSGSMTAHDSRGGRSRFEVLEEELTKVQEKYPGDVAVFPFSDYCEWNPSGHAIMYGGGTDMVRALNEAKGHDARDVLFIMISDGEPDSREETLRVARTYKHKIDTIYVGSERWDSGRDFLRELAQATGGLHQDDFKVEQLAAKIDTLLLGSG